MLLVVIGLILLSAIGIVVHVATLTATARSATTTRRPVPAPAKAPAVTLLRPACGIENNLGATLESSFELDYPNYEVVFCVDKEDDPVIPVIQALMAEHDHIPSRLLIGEDPISINPKLNNLVKGWAAARHDWVVMTDSNVLLPRDYIQYLQSYWDKDTGLVCSPAVGGAPRNFVAELECAFLNEHEARWQITADVLGRGFAQGKTMLWRKDILDRAGGIAALAREPAEDAASTKVVRQAGLKVRLMPGPFLQPLGTRSFEEIWSRQVRWARLRRTSFPLLFTPELFTGGLIPLASIFALAFLNVIPFSVAGAIMLAWYGLEILLARTAGWHVSLRTPFALVARDLLLPVLWAAGWTGNRFVWRGHAMDVSDAENPTANAPAVWAGWPRLTEARANARAHVRAQVAEWRQRTNLIYRRWRRRGLDFLRGPDSR